MSIHVWNIQHAHMCVRHFHCPIFTLITTWLHSPWSLTAGLQYAGPWMSSNYSCSPTWCLFGRIIHWPNVSWPVKYTHVLKHHNCLGNKHSEPVQWVMGMLWGPSDIRMIWVQPKQLRKSRGLKQTWKLCFTPLKRIPAVSVNFITDSVSWRQAYGYS